MAGKIANNFASLPVVFTSGQGAVLTDRDGKTYIDFVAGIGVNCLGHNHPALVKALTDQVQKQIHVSNYYNSDQGLSFADELTAATGMDAVFFGNSGAEANEAAIKLARKYGQLCTEKESAEKGSPAVSRKKIITLKQSFHGRTIATLKATGQEKFHNPNFAPYPDGFGYITANDFECLDSAFDESVCALFIEVIQGEGGVNLLDAKWAKAAAEAARKVGALVMVDEVQTGMGRTGCLLASQALGLEPDVVTLAKGIAGGVPMGACLYRGKANIFVAGDHQSTFGGNPLACAGGLAVLQEITSKGFLPRVRAAGDAIRIEISSWKLDCITQVRGRGLMIGIDITLPIAEVQKKCLAMGLCVSTAGTSTIRFLPPLVITDVEIAEGLRIFKTVLKGF